jgi:type IV secretory pathway VirB10-like protein
MLEQPHFEDELTVATARPVVPLERIDTKIKHRRRWFLGGAFAVAMLLGAASAVISAYFKLRNVPDPEIQSLSVLSVSDSPIAPVETVPEKTIVKTQKPNRPQLTTRNTDKTDYTQLPEDEALRRIRDAVLVDEWQEHRARRVGRVERREERREKRRAQHQDRDLSNIDEIFEGARHP